MLTWGNAATESPRGTDGSTGNSRTTCTELAEVPTRPRIASGPVLPATGPDTPARSSPLNDAELLKLATVRKNRRLGFLPTVEECDFLLDVLGRMG